MSAGRIVNLFLVWINVILFGKEHKLWSFSICTVFSSCYFLPQCAVKFGPEHAMKLLASWVQAFFSLVCSQTPFISLFCNNVCSWRNSPQWAGASSFTRFLDHTQRHTTVGRTPLDEWLAARRRDFYPTTHTTHYRITSISPVEFRPTISAGRRPQT
jgi:hypothetical protein